MWITFKDMELNFYDLYKIFPEAKPAIKRNLLSQIKQCKDDLNQALEIKRRFSLVINKAPAKDRWFGEMIVKIFYLDPLTDGREKKIKQNMFYLSFLNNSLRAAKNGKITDIEIQQAKEVPMSIIYGGELRKGNTTAVGQCPFHTDKTPSFTIYTKTNKWWCFSCQNGTDTIDFVMKRDGCDFITAVKNIIK